MACLQLHFGGSPGHRTRKHSGNCWLVHVDPGDAPVICTGNVEQGLDDFTDQ